MGGGEKLLLHRNLDHTNLLSDLLHYHHPITLQSIHCIATSPSGGVPVQTAFTDEDA
eukprot:jgi/Botrbrau1/18047/Bobra.0062s0035.1